MLTLHLILTTGSIVTMLLISILALLERPSSKTKTIFILLTVSLSGLLVDALPPGLMVPETIDLTGKLLSIPNVGLIWWFTLLVFSDRFQIGAIAWAGMIISSSGRAGSWLFQVGLTAAPPWWYEYISLGMELTLILHSLWIGAVSHRGDLIQPRREARIWVAGSLIIALSIMVIAQQTTNPAFHGLLRVSISFPISVLTLIWLARFRPRVLNFAQHSEPEQQDGGIAVKDKSAHERLLRIMVDDKPYLDPKLSVGALADRVGIPPHQLRVIINQGMGFRNFPSFLAKYRIDDVQSVLANPQYARTQILAIALDHGFASIATFNRAFKAETGQTASAYRNDVLKGRPAD